MGVCDNGLGLDDGAGGGRGEGLGGWGWGQINWVLGTQGN